MKLSVKVLPASSKDSVAGWLGDILKIKVRAPAEKGKANKAVINVLENYLDLPSGAVTVVSGATSQFKTLEIHNMDEAEIMGRLPS